MEISGLLFVRFFIIVYFSQLCCLIMICNSSIYAFSYEYHEEDAYEDEYDIDIEIAVATRSQFIERIDNLSNDIVKEAIVNLELYFKQILNQINILENEIIEKCSINKLNEFEKNNLIILIRNILVIDNRNDSINPSGKLASEVSVKITKFQKDNIYFMTKYINDVIERINCDSNLDDPEITKYLSELELRGDDINIQKDVNEILFKNLNEKVQNNINKLNDSLKKKINSLKNNIILFPVNLERKINKDKSKAENKKLESNQDCFIESIL